MAIFGTATMLGRRKAITDKTTRLLSSKGATSFETRVAPEEAGITSKADLSWIDRLAKEGYVGKAEDGKIWWIGKWTDFAELFGIRT